MMLEGTGRQFSPHFSLAELLRPYGRRLFLGRFSLKRWIMTSGLVVFPKTGHVVNQEEPALFNQVVADFIARVEAGRWPARDPRSVRK